MVQTRPMKINIIQSLSIGYRTMKSEKKKKKGGGAVLYTLIKRIRNTYSVLLFHFLFPLLFLPSQQTLPLPQ